MYLYFALLSILLGFLPLIMYLVLSKKLVNEISAILPFLILTFFSSLYEIIFTYFLKIDVSIWFKVNTLIEFLVLLFYFYKLLRGGYKWIYYFFGSIFFICLGFIILSGKLDNFMDGDAYLQAIESVFVITCVLLWMKYAFINMVEDSLFKYSHFYFVVGLLFYFTGTLFLFLLGSLILENGNQYFLEYWLVNLFFNIFFKILLLIGIWKGRVR